MWQPLCHLKESESHAWLRQFNCLVQESFLPLCNQMSLQTVWKPGRKFLSPSSCRNEISGFKCILSHPEDCQFEQFFFFMFTFQHLLWLVWKHFHISGTKRVSQFLGRLVRMQGSDQSMVTWVSKRGREPTQGLRVSEKGQWKWEGGGRKLAVLLTAEQSVGHMVAWIEQPSNTCTDLRSVGIKFC